MCAMLQGGKRYAIIIFTLYNTPLVLYAQMPLGMVPTVVCSWKTLLNILNLVDNPDGIYQFVSVYYVFIAKMWMISVQE